MIKRIIKSIFPLCCAIAFMQFPAFFHAYMQNLGGRVAELQLQKNQLEKLAQKADLSLTEYVATFEASKDVIIAKHGAFLSHQLARQNKLSNTYQVLTESSFFKRPFIFTLHFDLSIAQASFKDFHFALPMTTEAGIYAAVGYIIGSLFQLLFLALFVNKGKKNESISQLSR